MTTKTTKAASKAHATSDFEIEKGIPTPPRLTSYPFSQMDVGDSFFVPDGGRNKIASAASRAGLRTRKKFVVRKVYGGIRVWRLS